MLLGLNSGDEKSFDPSTSPAKRALYQLNLHPQMHRTGFEPVLPKESELESDALDHSAKDAFLKFQRTKINNYFLLRVLKKSVSTGFEPARAEPNGFQDHRLNHSAMTPGITAGNRTRFFG